jgi:hypothetical protein
VRLLDAEQFGEGPPQQRRGRLVEILGELVRHVRERAVGVRFPEPAAPALLEFGDEAQRLFRLPLGRQPPVRREHRIARAVEAEPAEAGADRRDEAEQHRIALEKGRRGDSEEGISEDDRGDRKKRDHGQDEARRQGDAKSACGFGSEMRKRRLDEHAPQDADRQDVSEREADDQVRLQARVRCAWCRTRRRCREAG